MGKIKWKEYNFEEIKEMLLNSSSYADWGRKMNYSVFNSKIAMSLFQEYPVLQDIAFEKFQRIKDLTGQRFGRLKVIKYSPEVSKEKGQGIRFWECECDCGNITYVPTRSLNNGNTRSCGCLEYENRLKNCQKGIEYVNKDLTGQKFELLTVIRQATSEETAHRQRKHKVKYWYCQCECGNFHIVCTSDLTGGKVSSCGCLNSKGEQKITSLLLNNNINFVQQYSFKDLINQKTQSPLFFDFAILGDNNKILYMIEYDGIQHFSKEHQFSKEPENLLFIQERDRIKNEYCFKNNIPLIRIPYTHFNSITINDLKLETSKFILKESDE